MIPRDYQRAAVDAAHDRTAEHGNTMLVLPTGAGKTAIAGFFVGEEAERQRDAKVAVNNSPGRFVDDDILHPSDLLERVLHNVGLVLWVLAPVVGIRN